MLKDKVVLITGASRGIGRASTLLLAQNRARVVVNYNQSEKSARDLIAKIKPGRGEAVMLKADVSDEQEVKKMFDEIGRRYGRLDVLVNNAGILKENLLLLTKTEEYEKVMGVNARGVFLCMRYAAKMMIRQKSGKIINLSSIAGLYGAKGLIAYSASKASVIAMTKVGAQELGGFGITVNAIAPGVIETDMTSHLAGTKQKFISRIALGRLGQPEDVARVVLFLSSHFSDYVNGQIIGVDGGAQHGF